MGKPINILLLEDSPDDAELVLFELEQAGYEVAHQRVMTEDTFRKALKEGQWDVILSDHSMPQFSGTDGLKILNEFKLDIPFIVVSGTIGEDAAVEEMRYGAADFFLKGNLKRLAPAIERELREAEERQARREAEAMLMYRTRLDRLVQDIAIAANAAWSVREILQLGIEQLCLFTQFKCGHAYVESTDDAGELVSSKIWYFSDAQEYLSFRELSETLRFKPDGSFVGKVLATKAPMWISDITEFESLRRKQALANTDFHTAYAFPIVIGDKVFAVIELFASQHLEPDESLLEVAGQISSLISRVVERERHEVAMRASEEQERQQRVFAEALKDSIATLTSTLDLDEVMRRILDSVGRVVPHDAANIMLIENDVFRAVYWHGYSPDVDSLFVDLRMPTSTPGFSEALDTGKPHLIPHTKDARRWVQQPLLDWIQSFVGVPIVAGGRAIGLLNLDSATPHFFTQQHAERLQAFANQAGVAIQNAQLYAEINQYSSELEARVAERTARYLQQKERVEAILHNTHDAIFLAKPDGRIEQTNSAFDELFGLDADHSFHRELNTLIFEDDREKAVQAIERTTRSGGEEQLEVLARRSDGVIFSAELSLSALQDEQNQAKAIVGSFHDITPHIQVKESLREALYHERELRALKSRFVSMATHELKTPLASILMSASMMRSYHHRISKDDTLRKLKQIEDRVKDLNQIVEDVLTIGRSEAGDISFDPRPTDLVAFCKELANELNISLQAGGRILLEATGVCPLVAFDPKLMRQALGNLLSNAVKYSPNDSNIYFRLRCEIEEFLIVIEDQGVGIPEEDQERLFEAFHRASNVGNISGTGLGLVIAQRAVELHDGTISVESQENMGTTFTIIIPIERPNAHDSNH